MGKEKTEIAGVSKETEKKSNTITIVSHVPADQLYIIEGIDEIAKKQKRSRSFVALELLSIGLRLHSPRKKRKAA